jgi:serine/threonine-protein kinase
VHLLVQACDSLDDAHRQGLVHRDIKPANLYLCKRGRRYDFLKVLDFGLVQVRQNEGDTRATAAGAILGTPAYLAPEMAMGEQQADPRTDLYSIGCVAYHLLTGVLVFDEPTPMGVAVAHATAAPIPPSKRVDRAIPEDLERIVMACLAKDPEDRPASALELAEQLRGCELSDTWTAKDAEDWWKQHLAARVGPGAHGPYPSEHPTALLMPHV